MDENKELEVQQNAETNEEVVSTESINTNESASVGEANSYKLIRDMLKEMKEYEKMMEDETRSILDTTYNLNSAAIMGISIIPQSKIDEMTIEEINNFFVRYRKNANRVNTFTDATEANEAINEVKKLQIDLIDMHDETKKIEEEANDIFNEYSNFLSSEEVINARKKRLANMKDLAEKETDETKKREMLKKIEVMELTQSLDFIFTRLDKFGDKEKKNIINSFFNEQRGSYIIEKFKTRIVKFGFNADLYKYFFNLEENFLDEKYHPFNNLFLFYYMRFVAYSDPFNQNDKLYVQSLTSSIANLVYHKFPSKKSENSDTENNEDKEHTVNAAEKHFIAILEKFDSLFEDKREFFYENNTTRPGHPTREKMSKKHEAERKKALIDKMDELHIEGYDINASADEIQKFFNEKMEQLIEADRKEREEKKKTEADDEIKIDSSELFKTVDIELEDSELSKTFDNDSKNDESEETKEDDAIEISTESSGNNV